jgi:hypothetical protein
MAVSRFKRLRFDLSYRCLRGELLVLNCRASKVTRCGEELLDAIWLASQAEAGF